MGPSLTNETKPTVWVQRDANMGGDFNNRRAIARAINADYNIVTSFDSETVTFYDYRKGQEEVRPLSEVGFPDIYIDDGTSQREPPFHHLRQMGELSKGKTYRIYLTPPIQREFEHELDDICEHCVRFEWQREAGQKSGIAPDKVHYYQSVPSRLSAEKINKDRPRQELQYKTLRNEAWQEMMPLYGVMLGEMDEAAAEDLAERLGQIVREGGALMISSSPRTHRTESAQSAFEIFKSRLQAESGEAYETRCKLFDFGAFRTRQGDKSENPYKTILKLADRLVLYGDSLSTLADMMTADRKNDVNEFATRLGKPIYVYIPPTLLKELAQDADDIPTNTDLSNDQLRQVVRCGAQAENTVLSAYQKVMDSLNGMGEINNEPKITAPINSASAIGTLATEAWRAWHGERSTARQANGKTPANDAPGNWVSDSVMPDQRIKTPTDRIPER